MKFNKFIFGVIAATLLIGGFNPSKAQASENGVLGIIIGGAAGGFIGSNIGKGRGQLAATAVGALLGAAIGNEMGENAYRTRRVNTVYKPTSRPRFEPVYQPTYKPNYVPRYKPVHASRSHGKANKVVVHKHKVIVKHVYVNPPKNKAKYQAKKRKKFEKRRRQLAQACYDNPRRCADAF